MIGLSLSPGGLLLPYHLGALAALGYHGILTDQTPLAGASAGAIAVAACGAGVSTERALEASIRVSSKCNPLFVARGQLLMALRSELDSALQDDAHERINQREGEVGLAHYEVYPSNQPKLQTQFKSKQSLIDAVCDSSMFPYFTTNLPFKMYPSAESKFKVSRVVLDGVFSEPGERFGCPNIQDKVDREVKIMVCPKELPFVLAAATGGGKTIEFRDNDIISPKIEMNPITQATRLSMMGTTSVPRKWLTDLYEKGGLDAERWIRNEVNSKKTKKFQRKNKVRSLAS